MCDGKVLYIWRNSSLSKLRTVTIMQIVQTKKGVSREAHASSETHKH